MLIYFLGIKQKKVGYAREVNMNTTTKQQKSFHEVQITGRRELWGARVFLLEASGGFQALREQMTREIGPEFASDILYRTGFASAERFMASVVGSDEVIGSEEANEVRTTLTAAFALLTEAGYGVVRWDESRGRPGEIGRDQSATSCAVCCAVSSKTFLPRSGSPRVFLSVLRFSVLRTKMRNAVLSSRHMSI